MPPAASLYTAAVWAAYKRPDKTTKDYKKEIVEENEIK